jgi:1-acyl-sn-glycerol-3-phosphate acyltransferase
MAKRSLWLTTRVAYETLAISAPTVIDAALGRLNKEASDARLTAWSKKVVAAARMSVTVKGLEHYDASRTYVIMSNHQSHYDVPVLYSVFGGAVRMIAKIELFKIPVFGKAMRHAGFIAIDRSNRESAIANLAAAKKALAEGTSIWIAPEGTRSPTGEIGTFKKGGFNVAFDVGAEILPVTIQGTRNVLPAQGVLSAHDVPVRITVHKPLATTAYTGERKAAIDAMMTDVRAAIESAL